MEIAPQSISPHLQRVLKSYQTSANRTLQGPGHGLIMLSPVEAELAKLTSDEYRKAYALKSKVDCGSGYRVPPPFPVQQIPVFSPLDSSRSEKSDTLLDGENIACFVVGGEKRLCLPQILNTVLRDYTLQEINTVCDDLHIFCSRCQPEQLEILKYTGILPMSAPSCGLITKTDAERLCNALLRNDTGAPPNHPSPNSFKVYHECFGKSKGLFNPEAYTTSSANCIQCLDCGMWLSPQKFVCHSHKALENRTCHWGFDSANWRSYLLLAKHQPGIDKLQDILEQMKCRFDSSSKHKRKQAVDGEPDLVKRSKSEEASSPPSSWTEQGSTLRAMMSAFQPWSSTATSAIKDGKMLPAPPAIMREGFGVASAPSYLHSGPPVLLHPDKVVPHSESSRYDSAYAPNVSLAPVQKCKGEDDLDDDDVPEKPHTPSPKASSSKTYKEWDLVTESDDSSIERFSPSDGEEIRRSPLSSQRALEIELEMIRQALDGKIGDKKEEKDEFLREFCKLRARHEELLNQSIQARRSLKQELANTKACTKKDLQDATDKTQSIEKELKRVRERSQQQLKEVHKDNEKLIKDVKALQEHEDIEVSKLLQVNQDLSARLQHYELAYEQLRCENIILQDKLHQLGINVLDIVAKPHASNGGLKLVKSPSRSPTETLPSRHRGYHGPMGSLPAHHMLEMMVKKERDT